MTPSQIRAEDGEVPDPQKKKGGKDAETEVNVAGHQVLPSCRKEEVSKELLTRLSRRERGHAVRVESGRTSSQKLERVRDPMKQDGKAAS